MTRARPPRGEDPVAFELRRHRRRIRRADVVRFLPGPELQARFDRLAAEFVTAALASDPSSPSETDACFADFRAWYDEEALFYGPRAHPGACALYWLWSLPGRPPLDDDRFEDLRLWLGGHYAAEVLDGNLVNGRGLVSFFLWWGAYDNLLQAHLMLAVREFREYAAAGRVPGWKRRKRRREAAAARRLLKASEEALPAAG